MLADLSSVRNLPKAQARFKRNRSGEDTADANQSEAADYAAALQTGHSSTSDHMKVKNSPLSETISQSSPVTTSLAWSSSFAPFAAAPQLAEATITVPTSAPPTNHRGYTSQGLGPAYRGAHTNLHTTLQHSSAHSMDASPELQAANTHQHLLEESYTPLRDDAQQGFYGSLQGSVGSVAPLHHGAVSGSGEEAQDLSSIFDLSSLEVPGAMDDFSGVDTHRAHPDTQCVITELHLPRQS